MDPVSRAQAENSAVSAPKAPHLTQYQWPKGVSGNRNGRPHKATRVTKMYERVLRKTKNRKEIETALMDTLTSKGMAKVLLLREMAERTEGKILQEIDMALDVTLQYAEVVSRMRARRAKFEPAGTD